MRYILVLLVATLATAQQSFTPRVIAVEGTPSQVLYAAFTGSGGIFKSTNGGTTWRLLPIAELGTAQPTSAGLAIDPNNPGILYLATTAASGYFLKSTDAGATWAKANRGIPATAESPGFFRLRSVVGTVLYLALGKDLYKSNDQAATWVRQGALPDGYRFMEISTSDPSRMYAVDANLGVYASTDEGQTWQRTATVPTPLTTIRTTTGVGIVHSNPNAMVVGIAGCCEVGGQGGYKSGDGGRTFSNDSSSLLGPFSSFHTGPGPQIYAQSTVAGGFYVSRDDGATWGSYFNIPVIGVTNGPFPDPKNRAIVYAYASTGGLVRSNDAAETWTSIPATVTPTLAKPAMVQITVEEGVPYQQPFPITLYENATWVTPVSMSIAGGTWLSLSTSSGNTPMTPSLRISSAGMTSGVYNASIKVDAPQANNPSITIPVQLTVLPRGSTGPRYRISSVAGNGSSTASATSGPALDIAIGTAKGIAADSRGNIFFTGGDRIWKLTGTNLSVLAGTGVSGSTGDGNFAEQATVTSPDAIAVNAQDDVFFSERFNSKIRRVSNGQIDAYLDRTKPGASAFFGAPGLAFDASGQLIMTAGGGTMGRYNGQAYSEIRGPNNTSLGLSSPANVTVGPNGDYFVSNQGTDQILRISSAGVNVYGGIGTAGFSGDGGPATQAQLNDPAGLVFDTQGTLYFADQGNNRIRAIRPDGTIRTIAGTGVADFQGDGSTANFAAFSSPVDIAIDRSGALYVSDRFNRRIRKLVKDAGPTPKPAALLHGASGNAKLSPGSLFSIYGELLSATTKITGDTPWPRLMDGVSVLINGVPAPLYFVSPTQINGQIPYETAVGSATAIVTVNGSEPIQVQFQVIAAIPGIIVYNGNRAVAVNPNGSVNASNAAAKPGDVELLYFSGIGIPDVTVATGEGSPVNPLARANYPYEIQLNGQKVDIAYLGLAPGYPALCQANFVIPNLAPGDYELKMVINGEDSNTTILTVGN